MIGNDGGGGEEMVRSSGGRSIIPKTWCNDGYGSVEEHEMRSDWGSRKGETGVDPRTAELAAGRKKNAA